MEGDQHCYISHYEVMERMVLCGYEPDAWLDSLPDTLTVPLRADYASLYDHTYYRLHGKDWYGTLAATDKYIRTAKPKTLNERRRAACLPSAR
jgi:hypothetical protein